MLRGGKLAECRLYVVSHMGRLACSRDGARNSRMCEYEFQEDVKQTKMEFEKMKKGLLQDLVQLFVDQ